MTTYLLPALFALAVWWASTVLIIYLDGLPRRTFRYSMAGACVVLAVSLWGLWTSARDPSVSGAYLAFTWGLLAWGWQEMSFYMGYVTGPRKARCPEGCRGWAHFVHAVQTSLWHELAIVGAATLVVALTWGAPNLIGLWTFMILWWMHQSAKLNVFLGVRNLGEEFLPEHLEFLKGFLTKRSMNLLFPVSVTVSTVIAVLLVAAAMAPGADPFQQAGYTFLAVLMALAILEHWMLVLPMPTGALWSAGLKSRAERRPFDVDIVVGFLGAGKTTTLRRMLAEADPAQKTVVLVNDFGELGLDGTLMRGQGAEVVELPNGCICCSLRKDLSAQLREVVRTLAPERILIEPSGVADVASLLRVLSEPEIDAMVRSRRLFTVIDAGSFLADYARMPEYFDIQARLAPVFVVNKVDLVGEAELRAITGTLLSLNPRARIVTALHGSVSEALAPSAAELGSLPQAGSDAEHEHEHGHSHGHSHGHGHHEHGHHEHGHHEHGVGAMTSWSRPLGRAMSAAEISAALEEVASGAVGRVERLKGIVRSGEGWLRFDIAGGRTHVMAHAPHASDEGRVLAIGRALDGDRLDRLFGIPRDVPETAGSPARRAVAA